MPAPFAHHESVAIDVEGTREVRSWRAPSCCVKPASAISTMTASAPPATATVAAPRGHQPSGVADGVGARGAGRRHGFARTAEAKAHGHRGGGGVGHHHGNEEGRDAVGSLQGENGVLFERRLQPADAGRDDAARVFEGTLEAALSPGLVGRHQARRERRGRVGGAPLVRPGERRRRAPRAWTRGRRDCTRASHSASTPTPAQVIAPSPVTATRRP